MSGCMLCIGALLSLELNVVVSACQLPGGLTDNKGRAV